MKYADYAKLPGLNSTLLSRFWESQDHALLTLAPSPPLEQGKAFERLLEDRVKGSNLFGERFFECDIGGVMPQDLPQWIFDGEDLSTKYRLKKDGERNNQSKTLHAYLDACQGNPGKIPIGKKDADMLGRAVNNMLKCEVLGHPFSEILAVAEFQKCVQWEREGIKKKALHDVFVQTDDINYIFDLKLYASFSNFRTMLRSKLWVQAAHYHEGAEATEGLTEPMMFMVASKEEPHLCKPFQIEEKSRMLATDAYWKLCQDLVKWEAEGRPPKGYLPAEHVKLWFNN